MLNAIRGWMVSLDTNPEWKQWRRRKFARTLYFDDPFFSDDALDREFVFPVDVEKQHAIVIQFLGLQESINLLKECEFYFRRYPFRGLPVTRYSHITNICEMYLSRFYEFRERFKKYLNAIKAIAPEHTINIGQFIKEYDRIFDQELRARNAIHHHRRFDDIAIDRIFLTEVVSLDNNKGLEQTHRAAYRKATREWAQRVKKRGAMMDQFLEVVASVTLSNCDFLTQQVPRKIPSDGERFA